MPVPVVEKVNDEYILDYDRELSIGKIKNFYGNFGVIVKSYAYVLTMGRDGLKKASQMAVLNANYLKENLKDTFKLPIDQICKHEFVLSGPHGELNTTDIAKRPSTNNLLPAYNTRGFNDRTYWKWKCRNTR